MQDPVPKMGKFGVLYARPGQRVILDPGGEMQVRPTHLDRRLASLNPCKWPTSYNPCLLYMMLMHVVGWYRFGLFIHRLTTALAYCRTDLPALQHHQKDTAMYSKCCILTLLVRTCMLHKCAERKGKE